MLVKTPLKQRYYLHLIQSANLAISELSQVLLTIANKRQTLAQKAITTELQTCIYWEGRLLVALTQMLKDEKYILFNTSGKALRKTNIKLREKLQEFNKAANHNLNYLEQYFEHDFWLELSNNQIARHLSQIFTALQDKYPENIAMKY